MSNFFSSLPNTQKWNRKIVVTLPSQNMFNLINLQRTNVILKVSKMNKNRKVVISRTQQKTKTKKTNWCILFNSYNLYKIFTCTPAGSFCCTSCLSHAYTTTLSQYFTLSHSISLSLWRASLSEELLSQLVVASLPVHQFLVSPSLLNSAVTNNNDLVGLLDGLQPVSDHQQRLVRTASQGLLNLGRVRDRNMLFVLSCGIQQFFCWSRVQGVRRHI